MITWFKDKKKIRVPLSPKKKDDFTSISSHELRTPLSIIKWYTEMLLDEDAGPLTEEQRKYLLTIESSNQRAIDLVRSLLNVSRLELGTFSITPTEVLVTESVEELLAGLSKEIVTKNLTKILCQRFRLIESFVLLLLKVYLLTLYLTQKMEALSLYNVTSLHRAL